MQKHKFVNTFKFLVFHLKYFQLATEKISSEHTLVYGMQKYCFARIDIKEHSLIFHQSSGFLSMSILSSFLYQLASATIHSILV